MHKAYYDEKEKRGRGGGGDHKGKTAILAVRMPGGKPSESLGVSITSREGSSKVE